MNRRAFFRFFAGAGVLPAMPGFAMIPTLMSAASQRPKIAQTLKIEVDTSQFRRELDEIVRSLERTEQQLQLQADDWRGY